MRIHPQAREYWPPELTALDATGQPLDPQPNPAGGWEASIDAGQTWHPSRPHPDHPDWPCWLVAGPDYPGTGDDDGGITTDLTIQPGRTRVVLIRVRDTPETIINATLTAYTA